MHSPIKSLQAVTLTGFLVAALFAVTGCQPRETPPANASDKAATDGRNAEVNNDDIGLATEKARASYMIGVDIGRSLKPTKDEIDLDVVMQAVRDVFDGKQLKLTDAQIAEVTKEFARRMQAKKLTKAAENLAAGKKFLADNFRKEGVRTTASGLQYKIVTLGNGPKPSASSTVKVHYSGTLLDGTKFDSSFDRGEPVTFSLKQVVPGWTEGLQLMSKGSKFMLWVPGNLGYGEAGTPDGPIPPNATLVFEIELLDILK